MVSVAALTARTAVPSPTLTTAGVCPQPEVCGGVAGRGVHDGDPVAAVP